MTPHRILFPILVLGTTVLLARPFEQTKPTTRGVVAGGTVTLTLTLDQAPNFADGQLAVRIGPKNSSAQGFMRAVTTGAKEEQRDYSISIAIPLGGPTGVSHVENLTFTLPNGEARPLKFKDADFTVLPRTGLIVPNSASLRIHWRRPRWDRANEQLRLARLQRTRYHETGTHRDVEYLSQGCDSYI